VTIEKPHTIPTIRCRFMIYLMVSKGERSISDQHRRQTSRQTVTSSYHFRQFLRLQSTHHQPTVPTITIEPSGELCSSLASFSYHLDL